jgi:hypothetical protein
MDPTNTSGARKRKVSGAVGDDDEDYVETGVARRSYFRAGTGYGGGRDDVSCIANAKQCPY